jgi:hypothetical protein
MIETKKNLIEQNNISKNNIGCFSDSQSKKNKIYKNDFRENNKNAYDLGFNKWKQNYWDDWKGLKNDILKLIPYKVPGRLIFNFDWQPAKQPYDNFT